MYDGNQAGHLVTFQTFTVGKLRRPASQALGTLILDKNPQVSHTECLNFQACACGLFQSDILTGHLECAE